MSITWYGTIYLEYCVHSKAHYIILPEFRAYTVNFDVEGTRKLEIYCESRDVIRLVAFCRQCTNWNVWIQALFASRLVITFCTTGIIRVSDGTKRKWMKRDWNDVCWDTSKKKVYIIIHTKLQLTTNTTTSDWADRTKSKLTYHNRIIAYNCVW